AKTYYEVNRVRHPDAPSLDRFEEMSRREGTAIVSENFAVRHNVRVGGFIDLPGVDASERFEIVGTLADYSWNFGTVLIHRSNRTLRRFGAWLPMERAPSALPGKDDGAGADAGCGQADAIDVYVPQGKEEEVRNKIQQSSWGARNNLFVMNKGEVRGHV